MTESTQTGKRPGRASETEPYSLRREARLSLQERVGVLVAEMKACIADDRPINLSHPPHREITEALHYMVYEKADETAELDIIYNDTSPERKRPTFPVRTLWRPRSWPDWESERVRRRVLNIGTLSFRHVAYDDYVDFYLLRDRETRIMDNLEIQEEACERMSKILDDPYLADESYISIYQTGLEPLVVGVYLAIVHHLKRRRSSSMAPLYVRPVFYADAKKQVAGKTLWG